MKFETIQRHRRSLVIGNLSFSAEKIQEFATNLDSLDIAVAAQERVYATELNSLWRIINNALAAMQTDGNVYREWMTARMAVQEHRQASSRFEEMMALTPPLMAIFRTPYAGEQSVHERLSEWWVAIGQHDAVAEIYKSLLDTNPIAESMTPDRMRPLVREWLATHYDALCEIGNMARAVQIDISRRRKLPTEAELIVMASSLAQSALAEMDRVPDLQRLLTPTTDWPYETTLAIFAQLPY